MGFQRGAGDDAQALAPAGRASRQGRQAGAESSTPTPSAFSAGARLVEPHAPRVPRVTLDQAVLQAAALAFAAGEIDRAELLRRISPVSPQRPPDGPPRGDT